MKADAAGIGIPATDICKVPKHSGTGLGHLLP
jgi:hypothetical protein